MSDLARPFSSCADYKRDGKDGHTLRSEEHQCAGFEEGIASALGSRTLFTDNASRPIMYGENIENVPSCSNSFMRRAELATLGFVRDLFDSSQELGDSSAWGFSYVTWTLSDFGKGTGNRGKNEPWKNDLLRKLTDKDGRSAEDYRWVAINRRGASASATNAAYNLNCSPIGD